MNIVLPQAEPNEQLLSVFEGDPVNLTVTFTAPELETIVSVSLTVSERGNTATSIVNNDNMGTITVTGSFTEIFTQQQFKVLDWKISEGVYVLPKVYTTYTSLGDVEADLNWDNIIFFKPDPRDTVIVTFSGVVTTEKEDEIDPLLIITTTYPYSFTVAVNQQFDNNKTIIENLVARSATE